MIIVDHEYFAGRAQEEDDAARSATCIEGRICHQNLADAYRRRCEDCPTCRGIWLDRGELDKILERSASDMAPSPPARMSAAQPEPYPLQYRYSDDYDDDYRRGDYRKRKKSLLSELLD